MLGLGFDRVLVFRGKRQDQDFMVKDIERVR